MCRVPALAETHHVGGRGQRLVDVDSAAGRVDPQDLAPHARSLSTTSESGTISCGTVSTAMQPNWSIGPSMLSTSAVARSASSIFGRPSGTGMAMLPLRSKRHDDRQRQLAMLAPQLHRHGQDRLQRALVVSAGAVGVPAAGEHQAAAALGDPGREVLHAHVAHQVGRRVLQQNGRIAGQFFQRPVALRGRRATRP